MSEIPAFRTEEEEAAFWDTHSATDFFDQTVEVDERFELAGPRKTLISLRPDSDTVDKLKLLARQKGIGCQTLIRTWLLERLANESLPEQMLDTPIVEHSRR